MDRQVKKVVKVTGIVLLCMGIGLQLRAGEQKTATAAVTPTVDTSPAIAVETASFTRNTFADVEARREQELEEKRNKQELAKKQNQKGKTVECQFWKQQKSSSSIANVDEKIAQFCSI